MRILELPADTDDDLDDRDANRQGPMHSAPAVPPALDAVLDMPLPPTVQQLPNEKADGQAAKRKRIPFKRPATGLLRRASFKRPMHVHSDAAVLAAASSCAAPDHDTHDGRSWTTSLDDLFASGVPAEAFPHDEPKGSANYTVRAQNGASIQVFMKKMAFYVQHSIDASASTSRTVSWKKHGGVEAAWEVAKSIAKWDSRQDL